MPEIPAVLARAIDLYWAFMPDAQIIDQSTLDTWQWKLCVELATEVEHQREPRKVPRF